MTLFSSCFSDKYTCFLKSISVITCSSRLKSINGDIFIVSFRNCSFYFETFSPYQIKDTSVKIPFYWLYCRTIERSRFFGVLIIFKKFSYLKMGHFWCSRVFTYKKLCWLWTWARKLKTQPWSKLRVNLSLRGFNKTKKKINSDHLSDFKFE